MQGAIGPIENSSAAYDEDYPVHQGNVCLMGHPKAAVGQVMNLRGALAARVTDRKGRSSLYVPITVDGRVVDSKGFTLKQPTTAH
jgi:hypothetical protein